MTLEADTEALIRQEAARTGSSFKEVLNQAVRRSLGPRSGKVRVKPLFPVAFPPGLEASNFNRLSADWEDEDTLREISS